MSNARRNNQNKVDLTLLPEVALYEECKVWMFGEKKYGRENWKKLWGKETVQVATASLLRHAFSLASGELFDSESGLPHAAHIRCNSAMILEYMARQGMIDPKHCPQATATEKDISDTSIDFRTFKTGDWE